MIALPLLSCFLSRLISCILDLIYKIVEFLMRDEEGATPAAPASVPEPGIVEVDE